MDQLLHKIQTSTSHPDPKAFERLICRIDRLLHFGASVLLETRLIKMRNRRPLISFTFDDFPREAWAIGGSILEEFGILGTFFTAIGLVGRSELPGEMFRCQDLEEIVEHGHELGCHTFSHCNAGLTPEKEYETAILENRQALRSLFPGNEFRTHSYPIGNPRLGIKRICSRHFKGSRGGGQRFNSKILDLNHISGFFLEQSRGDTGRVKQLIDKNQAACGWLIFVTHDVRYCPSRFGCCPKFFEEVVRYSQGSGAAILRMDQALSEVVG